MITTRLGYKVPKWHLTFLGFSQVVSGWTHFHNWTRPALGSGPNRFARTTLWDVICGWGMADTIHDVLNRKKRTDHRYRSGSDAPDLGVSEVLRVLFSLRVFGSHSEGTPSPGPSRCIPKRFFKFNFRATGCCLFERLALHALFLSRSIQGMTEYHRIRTSYICFERYLFHFYFIRRENMQYEIDAIANEAGWFKGAHEKMEEEFYGNL